MRVFAIGIEHAQIVAVDRLQHPDTGMHQEVPALSGFDQNLAGGLPLSKILRGLRQLHDVVGSIFQRYKLAPARQFDRIVESLLPAFGPSCEQLRAGL
jgi:hypothetical protein